MTKRESFYELEKFPYVERAILAEAVSFSGIKDVEGKFYLPVMTAGMENPTKATAKKTDKSYSSANYMTLIIPAYILFSFIRTSKTTTPVVPTKGIVNTTKITSTTTNMSSGTIPKGTVFLVEFLGGELAIDKTCIVGVLANTL